MVSSVGEKVVVRFEFSNKVAVRLIEPVKPEIGATLIVVLFEDPPGKTLMTGLLADREKSAPGTVTMICVALIRVPLDPTRLNV